MKTTRTFAILALVLVLGVADACTSSNPVAPAGTLLTIVANPTLIGILGESSTITVTGFRPDGNPLNPDTQITFSTSLGTITPTVAQVDDFGRAKATLTSTGQAGDATVTATTTAGETMAQIMVRIGDTMDSTPQLTINVSPAELNLNEEAVVTVDVRNADGSPFGAGGQIMMTTSLGRLESENLTTNAQSRATTRFFAGAEVGSATLRAFLGSAQAELVVTIENQRPSLILSVTPDDIAIEQDATVTVLARDENDLPLGAGNQIQLFTNLGSFPDAPNNLISTDANGRAITRYNAGLRAGTATITAILGSSMPVNANVTIRDVVGSFVLEANPTTIDRPSSAGTSETIRLTGRVTNSLGEPIGNVTIVFSTEVGGVFALPNGQPSSGNVVTSSAGVAEVDLTVTDQNIGPSITSFNITARVVAETAPGVQAELTVVIQIQG